MVSDSVAYLKSQGRRVFFDAEHFFDGYMLKDIVSLNVIQTVIITAMNNNLDWKADKTDDYLSHFCTQPVPGLFDKNVII